MSKIINYSIDKDRGVVLISHSLSVTKEQHLLPIDGKPYDCELFGITVSELEIAGISRKEFSLLAELDNGVLVYASGGGMLKAKYKEHVTGSEMAVTKSGVIVENNIPKSLSVPSKLLSLMSFLKTSPYKVKIESLTTTLIEMDMASYVPYFIRNLYTKINFAKLMPTVSPATEGVLGFDCKEPNGVEEFIFCVEDDGKVRITVEGGVAKHYYLPVDGGVRHLSEVGLSLDLIEKYIDKRCYLSRGSYFIELGKEVILMINALGLIEAVSSDYFMKASRASYFVREDGKLEGYNTEGIKLRSEAKGLIVYGILSSFNTVEIRSLLHILECHSIQDDYKEILEALGLQGVIYNA